MSDNYTKEIGVAGYRQASGYIFDEFLTELQGLQGRRMYREMRDNDATIGALMAAITNILRSTSWHVDDSEEAVESDKAELVYNSLMYMPAMTWNDALSEALSMLTYGFSLLEMIFYKCPQTGYYKPYKLAPRRQDTIYEWDINNNGAVDGLRQQPDNTTGHFYIPYKKILHFRVDYASGNPEGRSILRNAYRSYHFVKNLQMIEGIAAERELNGLPIVRVPSEVFDDKSILQQYEKLARDLKYNEQGGAVLPSDTYEDRDGRPTSIRKFEIELISSQGTRNIDLGGAIRRHQSDMARTVLADFLLLGENGGSYALSNDKTDLFLQSIKSVLQSIQAEINRKLIPTMWRLNGFDAADMPKLRHAKITPEDLGVMGDYVAKLASAGLSLNDEDTENHLRDIAGLPEAPQDVLSNGE